MNLCFVTLLLVSFYVIYLYFKKKLSFFKKVNIPHLPGRPIFGNIPIPFIEKPKHLTKLIYDSYNVDPEAKYVGLYNFMRPVIIIKDLQLIKEITIKNFDSFPDHRVGFNVDLDPLFGGNLFSLVGDKWRETRASLSPAFTSSKIKIMYPLMTNCAKNLVDYLNQLSESDRKQMDTKSCFTKYTNDVIAACIFGIDVNTFKDPNNDFYVLGKEGTDFGSNGIFKFLINDTFPRVAKFLNLKFVNDRVANFFTNVIKSNVEMRDEKGINRPDMLQTLINARNKSKDSDYITEMTAHAFGFFFGGFETTSVQTCTLAHELAINPSIQKKLQEEIDQMMENCKENPSYEDIQNLPYLDAVFNETTRMHSVLGMIDRVCKKPFTLPPATPDGKEFEVPYGTDLWIPVSAIHRDPKYYENPDKFDPDRYLEKKVSINDVMNLGFGIGPRSCIGNRFAILETKILLTFLLYKFNLKPNEKTCKPLVYDEISFTLKPKDGFWLSVESR